MKTILGFLLLSLTFAKPAQAQIIDPEQILLIRETARDICQTVENADGSQTTVEIEGNISTEINGLLRRLANLGIEGGGSISSEEFEGLSREATAEAMTDSLECRERLFNTMFNALMTPSSGSLAPRSECPNFDLGGSWQLTNIPLQTDGSFRSEIGRQNVFDVVLAQNCNFLTGRATKVMYGNIRVDSSNLSFLELASTSVTDTNVVLDFTETWPSGRVVGRGTISLRHSGAGAAMTGEFRTSVANISGTSLMVPR